MSQLNDHNRLTGPDDTTLSHIQACDLKGTGSAHHKLPTFYLLCFGLSASLCFGKSEIPNCQYRSYLNQK